MKNKYLIILIFLTSIFSQNSEKLLYEKALSTIDGDKALSMYEQILKSNSMTEYYWLSLRKKAEINYAKGLYISSSNLWKEFNLNAPSSLIDDESKNFLFRSLNVIGEDDSVKYYQRLLSSENLKDQKKISSFPDKKSLWYIQFGVFSSKESAEIMLDSLLSDGIKNVLVVQLFERGKMKYYVRTESFTSNSKAQRFAKRNFPKSKEYVIISK